jgi:hypothetical protein
MSNNPTLYDLFDTISLQNCERQANIGEIPAADQLADIMAANPGEPLPLWFNELVVKALRRELKQKAGRRKESAIEQYRFAAAALDYKCLLSEPLEREKASDLRVKSSRRDKQPPSEPPHVRIAKSVIQNWRLHMSWRAFLNRVSSEKWS